MTEQQPSQYPEHPPLDIEVTEIPTVLPTFATTDCATEPEMSPTFTDSDGGRGVSLETIGEWYANHRGYLGRVAYKYTGGNPDDAEDLIHQAFLNAMTARFGYTQQGKPRAWMSRITMNAGVDSIRRKKHIEFIGGETHDIAVSTTPAPENADTPGATVEQSDFLLRLKAHVDSKYYMPLILHVVEGYKYDEIAEILGINSGTVRSRIHRGKAQARVALLGSDFELPAQYEDEVAS